MSVYFSEKDDAHAKARRKGNTVSRWFSRIKHFILYESTFFRLHLAAFTFIPLIFSAIFWGCNGRFEISYLDSLFLCYSAMTVTGLSTINLSTTTAWQQVILYLLMMIGDITVVSWVMVLVRKEYFKRKCQFEYVKSRRRFPSSRRTLLASISSPVATFRAREPVPSNTINNPVDKYPDTPAVNFIGPTPVGTMMSPTEQSYTAQGSHTNDDAEKASHRSDPDHVLDEVRTFTSSPRGLNDLPLSQTLSPHGHRVDLPYTTSMTPSQLRMRRHNTIRTVGGGVPIPQRTLTILTNRIQSPHEIDNDKKYSGLGGFPGPIELARKAAKHLIPNTYRKIERKMTLPYTTTVDGHRTPWLTANATLTVGRNSDFAVDSLTDQQVEEIGGAEYKALRWLSYLVPAYFVATQLIAFLLFAPWLSATHEYDDVFEGQARLVQKPWFALFQVMGAYTGGGLSLVDQGMVPFQKAYLMSFAMMFVILAGNHALPIFLRFVIWVGSRLARKGSDAEQAFSFLLDHPRRCFIYLFPSHQTWFLVICLILFSAIEWVAFEVLDIGLEVWTSLSTGPRIVCGLFQGLAARASGFSIIAVASAAPALQFLYVVMMYIAVYPVALSIRSTNVYEEQSLGVFEVPPDDEEPGDLDKFEPRQRIGRYVGWHLRRQLSLDIWWLVWGVFLIAIIERHNILDPDLKWFDLFRVLFELVSAFGGIGLSLGLPTDNFAFVGAMRPLSKLVIIVIMVRGRHRGLPVAVDKAVMLPSELMQQQEPQKDLEPENIQNRPSALSTRESSQQGRPPLSPTGLGLSVA